ncbi:flagellar basal-body MS-ring/collar protein FliF [Opacimonas viscosa]|uniref:Flagellar M-ring protein n=1 Tax=Opacimonas viscosa TaxID=2961944 RepID=A0AA42BKI8_9ALTE|nr:flagellar basal-body MS-ring/collar protein FliF [Opacimonas viscosa]MCP3427823.1 flagellar M-ring protein FliF [Opacimonas viscosa]
MAEATNTELAISDDTIGSSGQAEQKSGFLEAVGTADMMRQLTLVVALVICIAIAIFIVIWAQQPEYRPLGTYQTEELIETLDHLDQNQIPYRLEGNTILVEEGSFQNIKLGMARQGLQQSSDSGSDIIMQDMGFGVSQRLEMERLKHAREQKIARTIEKMNAVQSAQVLLAIPKENVFARREKKPSATVVLKTKRGSVIASEEVDSIVDIVASAVPGMIPESVTVTDSTGRLLNSGSQNSISSRARKEYEIENKRESEYLEKIDSILIPILGLGNYTAQVDVTMDFTSVEQTQRRYNPDLPAVRSEQTSETITNGSVIAGIPGALSNQPPADAQLPEDATGANANERVTPSNTSKEATRNFELDTTISHTKQQTGVLSRLSVSVAVDYINTTAADGTSTSEPRAQEQLMKIRQALQGAIGFDVTRGDSLEVVSIPFTRMDLGAVAEIPFWEQPRFLPILKLALSALVIIVLIIFVVRPMLRRLIDPNSGMDASDYDADEGLDLGDDTLDMLNTDFDEGQVGFASDGSLMMPDLHRDEDVLKAVRALVANEPELSAQVVKGWLLMDE